MDLWLSYLRASRANPSRAQGKDAVPKTRGTSGRTLAGSFAKYDRESSSWKTCQISLTGTPREYLETWPRAGMMLGGIACQRQPLAPLTAATDSRLWPSPTRADAKLGTQYGNGSLKLAGAVKAWPTPTARLGKSRGAQPKRYGRGQRRSNLDDAVAALATVSAPADYVTLYPTPTVSDATGGASYRQPPSRQGSPGLKEVTHGGPLNPTWVEWLMGWPLGWTDLRPLGTARYLSWRRSHSAAFWRIFSGPDS